MPAPTPDPIAAALAFENVWFEPAALRVSPSLDLRCLGLAVAPEQLESTLATLARARVPIEPRLYPRAAITRILADGRAEQIPAIEVEFVARLEAIPAILASLRAAQLLPRGQDRAVLVRSLATQRREGGQIFPAGPPAPYLHFIRWREAPGSTAPSPAPLP